MLLLVLPDLHGAEPGYAELALVKCSAMSSPIFNIDEPYNCLSLKWANDDEVDLTNSLNQ